MHPTSLRNAGRLNRRQFFLQSASALATFSVLRSGAAEAWGQGDFRYRVVPDWGDLKDGTPVKNCHGIVCDASGHIVLLTDHTANNVIVYDQAGKLVHKWGSVFPGAHGLSIVREGAREVLFITDLQTHRVVKATLDGQILDEWRWPEQSGKYGSEAEYKPSWTLHLPDGGFFVLDGYGRDFITQHDAAGKFVRIFGGAEGGISHWGPHGGMVDGGSTQDATLLIAMSDQQHLLRLSQRGEKLGSVDLPGGNPRQIRRHAGNYFVAHLGDNWPKDRNCRGFVSVLDADLRVVSNVGGSPPEYGVDGKLRAMTHVGEIFMHPHDLVVDGQGSLYVAQFASQQTYPIKLERI
jgi:sugar lactone lactonase YvrE